MATIDTPTSAEPPTDGPVVAAPAPEVNIANQDGGEPMPRLAPLEDLSGIAADAVSAGEAWAAGAAQWADSPQGAGLDGWTLSGDHPSGAAADHWPSDMSFPHQGP